MVGWFAGISALLTLLAVLFGAERIYHRYFRTQRSDVTVSIPESGQIHDFSVNDERTILTLEFKNAGELDASIREIGAEYDLGREYNLADRFPESLIDDAIRVTEINSPEVIEAGDPRTTANVKLALTNSNLLGTLQSGPGGGVVPVTLTVLVEDAEQEYEVEADGEIEISAEELKK
jgi:hypothetical protein